MLASVTRDIPPLAVSARPRSDGSGSPPQIASLSSP